MLIGWGALVERAPHPLLNSRALPSLMLIGWSSVLLSLSLTVEHLKVRVYLLGWGVSQSSLLTHPLLISRAPKGPYGRAPKGPLLSLSVEPPKGSLTVEPACASLSVEPAYAFFQTIFHGALDACLWKT
jgi:hypothetical protein